MSYTKDEMYTKLKAKVSLLNEEITEATTSGVISTEQDLNTKYKAVETAKAKLINSVEGIKNGLAQQFNETLCYAAEYRYLEEAEEVMDKLIEKIKYFNSTINGLMFDYLDMMRNPDTFEEGKNLLAGVLGDGDADVEVEIDEDGNPVVKDKSGSLVGVRNRQKKVAYSCLASNSALSNSSLEHLSCSMDFDDTDYDDYETDLSRWMTCSIPIAQVSNLQFSSRISEAWEYDTSSGFWSKVTSFLDSLVAKYYRNTYYGLGKNSQGEVYGYSLSFKKSGFFTGLFSSTIYTNFMDTSMTSGYKLKLKKGYEVMTYDEFHELAKEDEVDNKDTKVYFALEFEGNTYYIMEDGSETYSANINVLGSNYNVNYFMKFEDMDKTSTTQFAESVRLIMNYTTNSSGANYTEVDVDMDFSKVEDGYHKFVGNWDINENTTIPLAIFVKYHEPDGDYSYETMEYYIDYDPSQTISSTEYSIAYPAIAAVQTRRLRVPFEEYILNSDELSAFPDYNLAAIQELLKNCDIDSLDALSDLLNLLIQQLLDEIYAYMNTVYITLNSVVNGFALYQSNCSGLPADFSLEKMTEISTLVMEMEESFFTGYSGLTIQEQVERLQYTYDDNEYGKMYNTILDCLNTVEEIVYDYVEDTYTALGIVESYDMLGGIDSVDDNLWKTVELFYNVYTKNLGAESSIASSMVRMSFGIFNPDDFYSTMLENTQFFVGDIAILYLTRIIMGETTCRNVYNNEKLYGMQTDILKKNNKNYIDVKITSDYFDELVELEKSLYDEYKLKVKANMDGDVLPSTLANYSSYIYSLNDIKMEDMIGVGNDAYVTSKIITGNLVKELLKLRNNPSTIRTIMNQLSEVSIREIVLRLYLMNAMDMILQYMNPNIENNDIDIDENTSQINNIGEYTEFYTCLIEYASSQDREFYWGIFLDYMTCWENLYGDARTLENNLNLSNTEVYGMLVK